MGLRIPIGFILRIVAQLALIALTCAFDAGQTFSSRLPRVDYKLEKQLGRGDFGEVWEVTATNPRTGTSTRITLKFYHQPDQAKDKLTTLKMVAEALRGRNTPNLMPVNGPMILQDGISGAWHSVVPGMPGDGDIGSLRNGEFAIDATQSADERARRVRNAHQLMTDLTAASNQAHEAGLVHHDLNPRNVIRVDGRYRANDFEGATKLGERPPVGAWEFPSAAPEYGDGVLSPHAQRQAATYGPLGDLWTTASTVYFAQHGETPLTTFARQQHPQLFAQDQIKAIQQVRRDLVNDEPTRARFRQMVRDQSAALFQAANVPAEAAGKFRETAQFLAAALEPLPLERRDALKKTHPDLPQLKHDYALVSVALPPLVPSAPISPLAAMAPQAAPKPPRSRGRCTFAWLTGAVVVGPAAWFGAPLARDAILDHQSRSQFQNPRVLRVYDQCRSREGLGMERKQAEDVARLAANHADPEKFFAAYQRGHEVGQDSFGLHRSEAMRFAEIAAEQRDPDAYLDRLEAMATAGNLYVPTWDRAVVAHAFARSTLPESEAGNYARRYLRAQIFAYSELGLSNEGSVEWATNAAFRADFEDHLKRERQRSGR